MAGRLEFAASAAWGASPRARFNGLYAIAKGECGNLRAGRDVEWLLRLMDAAPPSRSKTLVPRDDEPLILVDITALDPDVHNRHDKNAVNDVDKASTWRRTIEREYQKYSNDAGMIAAGTVRGCARGVYLAALQQLRDEVPGHYWVAVFPPASP